MTMSRKGREMGRRGQGTSSRECGLIKRAEAPENTMLSMEWLLDVSLHFSPLTKMYCCVLCHLVSNALDTKNYARQ